MKKKNYIYYINYYFFFFELDNLKKNIEEYRKEIK